MPRASGSFTPPSSSWYPATSGNAAAFGDWNTLLADLSSALTQSISQDGQTNPTANLPMAGFKHTGAGNASGSGQYIAWGQACTLGALTGATASFTTLTATDGSGLAALNASNLGSGTVPNARFPAVLPAISGINLTSIPVSNISAGPLPLTVSMVAGQIASGTLPASVNVSATSLYGDIAAVWLLAAFVAAPGNNYIVFPNGTIIQWGSVAHANGFNSSYSISFNVTFPNEVRSILAVPSGGNGGFNIAGASSTGLSGATLTVSNRDPGSGTGTGVINWIAIGR